MSQGETLEELLEDMRLKHGERIAAIVERFIHDENELLSDNPCDAAVLQLQETA